MKIIKKYRRRFTTWVTEVFKSYILSLPSQHWAYQLFSPVVSEWTDPKLAILVFAPRDEYYVTILKKINNTIKIKNGNIGTETAIKKYLAAVIWQAANWLSGRIDRYINKYELKRREEHFEIYPPIPNFQPPTVIRGGCMLVDFWTVLRPAVDTISDPVLREQVFRRFLHYIEDERRSMPWTPVPTINPTELFPTAEERIHSYVEAQPLLTELHKQSEDRYHLRWWGGEERVKRFLYTLWYGKQNWVSREGTSGWDEAHEFYEHYVRAVVWVVGLCIFALLVAEYDALGGWEGIYKIALRELPRVPPLVRVLIRTYVYPYEKLVRPYYLLIFIALALHSLFNRAQGRYIGLLAGNIFGSTFLLANEVWLAYICFDYYGIPIAIYLYEWIIFCGDYIDWWLWYNDYVDYGWYIKVYGLAPRDEVVRALTDYCIKGGWYP